MVFIAELDELYYSLPSISPRAEGGAPVTTVASNEPPVPAVVTPGDEFATPYMFLVEGSFGTISCGYKGELKKKLLPSSSSKASLSRISDSPSWSFMIKVLDI